MVDLEGEDVEEGQLVDCPECGAELEVVSTNPVELDLAEEEEMDDEEEEEQEEEELDEEEEEEEEDYDE
jgi:hypothetical protein